MAGIISKESQWKYFKRPGAYKGSVTSVWMKHFKMGGGSVNGLAWHIAKYFVNPNCKPIRTAVWAQRDRKESPNLGKILVTWVEFERHLRADTPDWIKESAQAMAKFQRWLHGTDHVNRHINKLIKEREKCRF